MVCALWKQTLILLGNFSAIMYKGCDTKTSNIWFYFTFPHPRVKWILMCLKEIRKLINLNHLKLEKKTMQICALYCFEAYIYLAFSVYKLRTESSFTAHLSIKYKCSVFLFFFLATDRQQRPVERAGKQKLCHFSLQQQ